MLRPAIAASLLLASALATSQYPGAKPAPGAWSAGFKSINATDAQSLVATLAGPDFLGRKPGDLGYPAAAGYCMAWFQRYGLLPAGEGGSYFQRFTTSRVSVLPASAILQTADGAISLKWGSEFVFGSPADVDAQHPVAFVRLAKGSDLADLSAFKDKLVILHPDSLTENRPEYDRLLRLHNSGELGAVAVSLASTSATLTAPAGTLVLSGLPPGKMAGFRVTSAAANRLAEASKASKYLLPAALASSVEVSPLTLRLAGKVESRDTLPTMNVLAKIEGSDPKLKSETVVIGSHLDHMGETARGLLFGADDNASGVTATLMAARAFALNKTKPKRTIVFALWTMEESGLVGSRYYTEKPTHPLANTVAYLNMDMVGRDSNYAPWNDKAEDNRDSVYISAAKQYSPELDALLRGTNRFLNLRLRDDKEDRARRSDTGNFIAKNVPTLKAFTGEHPDYHRATDTPEKINYFKLATISKWIYLSAAELGTAVAKPKFALGASMLRGTLDVLARTPLSPEAVAEISLLDVSRADAKSIVLDKTTMTRPGQFPLKFGLVHRQGQIVESGRYAIQAKILVKGKVVFVTTTAFPVLTGGAPKDSVTVMADPVLGK